jgi:hypothetical protein
MSGMAVVIIIAVAVIVVVVLVGVTAAMGRRRHARLRDQFGSEYDRTIDDSDSRRKGERELQARTERREKLDIVPLSENERDRYRDEWRMVQERFVDAPAESVAMAHSLLTAAMGDRGYPIGDQDERASMLSVDNADVVDQYRQGVAIEQRWRDTNGVETEDLRQAMQHYRAVFGRVVGAAPGSPDPSGGNAQDPRVPERA